MEGSVLAAEPCPPNLAERNGQSYGGSSRLFPPSGESMFSGTLLFHRSGNFTVGANIVRPWVCYSSVKMPYASSLEEVSEGRRSHPYNRPLYKLHEKG